MIARRGFFARVAAFCGLATIGKRQINKVNYVEPSNVHGWAKDESGEMHGVAPATSDQIRVQYEWRPRDDEGFYRLIVQVEYGGVYYGKITALRTKQEPWPVPGVQITPGQLPSLVKSHEPTRVKSLPGDATPYSAEDSPLWREYLSRHPIVNDMTPGVLERFHS